MTQGKNDNYFCSSAPVFIAELSQETNNFVPMKTDIEEFKRFFGLIKGEDAKKKYTGTNTVVGGFIDGCDQSSLDMFLSLIASAHPGGLLTKHTYEMLRDSIIDDFKKCSNISGVLISLHGSMVAEDYDDPEGDILKLIRQVIGYQVPIVGVIDMHASVTQEMINNADVLLGFNTWPHVDLKERGIEAAKILNQILMGKLYPVMRWVKLPLIATGPKANTNYVDGPITRLQQLSREYEKAEDIVDISILNGFYCDIPHSGASVICTTNNNSELAQKLAGVFANKLWDSRKELLFSFPTPEEAVQIVINTDERPVMMVDYSDSPSAGCPGDTTTLLQTALSLGIENAVFSSFYDPETVEKAIQVGVGNIDFFDVGGKVYPEHGAPCRVLARVKTISDGELFCKSSMENGKLVTFGRTVVLNVIEDNDENDVYKMNVSIIVAEKRVTVIDPEMLRFVGLEPTAFKVVTIKGRANFRVDFGPLMKKIIEVDAPGFGSPNLKSFEYKNIVRPLWPIDDDFTWNYTL